LVCHPTVDLPTLSLRNNMSEETMIHIEINKDLFDTLSQMEESGKIDKKEDFVEEAVKSFIDDRED